MIQSLVGTDNAYAMALQQDGKFVMAGNCINGLSSFICAARFTTAGALTQALALQNRLVDD